MTPRSEADEPGPRTEPPPLERLEIHSGIITGRRRTPLPPEDAIPHHESDIRDTLEEILLPVLSRSPCLAAFSGGRDSSVILALATRVARRHGLDDPVPITFRFPDYPRTRENDWQELVIRHLGLKDWEILSGSEHFDALGPHARDTLQRHGLYWPPNTHTIVPLLRAAAKGAVITGRGGDEVFTPSSKWPSRWQLIRALPPVRAMKFMALYCLPDPWRTRVFYRGALRLAWLRRRARREARRRFLAEVTGGQSDRHPFEVFNESRYLELSRGIGRALARDAGVTLVHPFLEPRFLRALIRTETPTSYPSRPAALEALFGDLLPAEVLRRSSKALFTEALWHSDSREFAARWDGEGVDPSLVDPDALRREWAKPRPDFRSVNLLHAAWLAGFEEARSGAGSEGGSSIEIHTEKRL